MSQKNKFEKLELQSMSSQMRTQNFEIALHISTFK